MFIANMKNKITAIALLVVAIVGISGCAKEEVKEIEALTKTGGVKVTVRYDRQPTSKYYYTLDDFLRVDLLAADSTILATQFAVSVYTLDFGTYEHGDYIIHVSGKEQEEEKNSGSNNYTLRDISIYRPLQIKSSQTATFIEIL